MPEPITYTLIVGLGNPGADYAHNRHNIGFMAVDAIADLYGFGAFRRKYKGLMVEGKIDGARIILLKPETFMNLSGTSVSELASFYKIPCERMVVIHDELDLPPGKLRVKMGGGAAGHNGLKSLDQHLPNANYKRIRMGIGHPGDRDLVTGYVLGDFAKSERDMIAGQCTLVAKHIGLVLDGQDELFMTRAAGNPSPLVGEGGTPKA
jgi:PTH1 family peptidyl-tRNA hydrolase